MDTPSALESVFREESGRILATLIRLSGSFDRAEEALQEAFASALASWPESGIPRNAAAWLTTAAHRKLIDQGRRERTRRAKQDAVSYETPTSYLPDTAVPDDAMLPFSDDRLRLIFTCCHPALSRESQIALTLRTLGGLTTEEIAKAFLISEPTLAQRLVRAKRKIQDARIPYEIPPPSRFPERLVSVQAVIYLIFNEGYTAASGHDLMRVDLCAEAVRLARVLNELLPADSENKGLLALMLLHHSRRNARAGEGELITLDEQDRSRWHQSEIAEGLHLVEQALAKPPLGPYQLQAAIAALHAQAKTAAETDWPQITALYERLLLLNDSAVVALNHAVALAMSAGWEEGLRRLDRVAASGELDEYYLLHAARADILRRMHRTNEAKQAYSRALSLTGNLVERRFLQRRFEELGSGRPDCSGSSDGKSIR